MHLLRAAIAFALLMLGGLIGLLAQSGDSCTGNSPDSLYAFILVVPLNLAGMLVLGWKPRLGIVMAVSAIPAVLSLSYLSAAIALLTGTSACDLVSDFGPWEKSGEEMVFAAGWGISAAIFWLGLASAALRGYRAAHDRDADAFARIRHR